MNNIIHRIGFTQYYYNIILNSSATFTAATQYTKWRTTRARTSQIICNETNTYYLYQSYVYRVQKYFIIIHDGKIISGQKNFENTVGMRELGIWHSVWLRVVTTDGDDERRVSRSIISFRIIYS